jgi:hypothetical protein
MPRRSIFICSSSAGLDVANALQQNLATDFEAEVWNQGAFALGQSLVNSIIDVCKRFDFGVIVLTPDSLVNHNGNTGQVPRDNVLFELGLFIGQLGMSRTFIVHENTADLRLPDYIHGVGCGRFTQPKNGSSMQAALGPISHQIRTSAKAQVTSTQKKDLIDKTLMVVSRSLINCLHEDVHKLRAFVFRKEDNHLVCTNYWAPYQIEEVVGELSFEINAETEKQVAVVKAAVKRQVCAVSVTVLPEHLDGVHGKVDPELCFILAAPILSPSGQVWGTVDFDASSKEAEMILKKRSIQNAVFELGRILYPLVTMQN